MNTSAGSRHRASNREASRGKSGSAAARPAVVRRHPARNRLEAALARIADPEGEGPRACLTEYAQSARVEADAADARASSGLSLGALDGAIVSIKDLFDVRGEPTRAGSTFLAQAPPAVQDAPVVRRLRAAGAVIVAKTNMTEFAFSGVGLNPHYGTPGNPADRSRIPGGSSSGAAVAVADGMCEIAIGTDTGGSTRIPAALCGIVGFKPSQWRVPTDGAFPLSFTLDSVGPLARTVADCALADAVMAAEEPRPVEPASIAGLRLGIAQGLPLKDLDHDVGRAFAAATTRLKSAGVRFTDESFPQFDAMLAINAKGGFAPAEAFALHRDLIASHGPEYDPNVRARIERGRGLSAADYVLMSRERARLIREIDARLEELDALVMSATAIVAPKMADVATPETFGHKNMMLLRNTALANFFDLCAISLPLPRDAGLPVGLMLVARNGHDHHLFRIAAAVEQFFAGKAKS
jgi:aspartyl-tRNA(Asn)/glutamyl-tRNA(Gln) amidotransferase subunit A